MAKKIRFPLKMKNGAEVRTLDELKENFDLESVLGYFTDGKLHTWLADRYYDEKVEAVTALSADTSDLNAKLCEILEVEYEAETDETDLEYIQRRNEKLKILSAVTADQSILNNVDFVAMNQDDLYDILDESPERVYLYGEKFEIPLGRKNTIYEGINSPLVILENKDIVNYEEADIKFKRVTFEKNINPYLSKGERLFLEGKSKEAFQLIEKSANNGNPRAMYIMAQYYNDGYEVVKINVKERNNWCEKAFPYKEPLSMYGYATWCVEDGSEEQKRIYSQIFSDIKEMAELDDIIAKATLGCMYDCGYGSEQNKSAALEWYRKAAEQGNANAQCNLGYMYRNGNGITQDYEGAVNWYRKAAEQGSARGQYNIGSMYYNGTGVSKNYDITAKYLIKSAEQGFAHAQYWVGFFYENGYGVEQNKSTAAEYYKKASDQGNINATFNLGKMYAYGDGIIKNYDEADKLFTKYVKKSWDCFRIGEIYEEADKNYEKAIKWYTKASEYENPETDALIALGRIQDKIYNDYNEATKWYQKAIDQKESSANEIGNLYNEGEKVTQDYTKAVEWYRKGTELKNPDAFNSLGKMYEEGKGVERNKEKAIELYTRAIELFSKILEETKIAVEKGEKAEYELSRDEYKLNMANFSLSHLKNMEHLQNISQKLRFM